MSVSCQKRSFDHIVRTAQEAYSGNPAFRRPSINSFEFLGTRAICADIVKAGSISSARDAAASWHKGGILTKGFLQYDDRLVKAAKPHKGMPNAKKRHV